MVDLEVCGSTELDAVCKIIEIQLFFLHAWYKFGIETTANVHNRAERVVEVLRCC